MHNPYGTPEYKKLEAARRAAAERAAALKAKEQKNRAPPLPMPVIKEAVEEQPKVKYDPFAALRELVRQKT